MESSGGKGRLTLARGDSRFDGSQTVPPSAYTNRTRLCPRPLAVVEFVQVAPPFDEMLTPPNVAA
jgi:hypothetical protein